MDSGAGGTVFDNVLRLMRKSKEEADGLEVFSRLLLSSTVERSLAGLDSGALAQFAQQAFQHLARKPHKRHAINFRSTELLGAGEPSTVLEILNDDMPFAVESVISELHADGLIPRLVFHPIYKVKRYGSGRLQSVVGPGDRHWGAGDQESYIALLLEPIDASRQQGLLSVLDRVLDDVRTAAADGDQMRARIAQAIGAYESIQLGLTPQAGAPAPLELKEAADLLRWLGQGNFTLLGMRDYEMVGLDPKIDLWPSASGALGTARAHAADEQSGPRPAEGGMSTRMREIYNAPHPLIFSKSTLASRVRRRVPLDCIGIKRYTPNGKLLGELRVFGLFTPASYMQPVETVPVIRQKVRRVLADAQFPPDSHNGRTLIDILEHFPRDELLQIGQGQLFDWSMTLIDLSTRPRTAVLTRRDDFAGYTSALVFVPRDHYSSNVRERIGAHLEQRLGGKVVAYYPYISATPLVRTQLIIVGTDPARQIPAYQLDQEISGIILTWDERLADALARRKGRITDPTADYAGAFSAGYTEMFQVDRALEDIARIERLGPASPVAIDFYREPGWPEARVRAAIYRFDAPIPLSERVPLLENMGFKAIEERSYRVRPRFDGIARDVVLHDMVLESADGAPVDLSTSDQRLEETFLAVFHGKAENDPFNALIIAAGLDWREAAVLRAFALYMRQTRAPFSPRYVAETLQRYAHIARDIYALFHARFADPCTTRTLDRDATAAIIRERIERSFPAVTGLDEDRILRRLLNIAEAVVRTNAFHAGEGGERPFVMAFKIASREIDRLPEPKPYREIFVCSPRLEGVHLRFAPIARGGIRWSDRAQDYRTEVLGLAKAQQVKNTVIVPSGAKGGFVPKQIRRDASREDVQAEGVACYRLFIEALLSLTDNIRDGAIVPPAGIERRDGDDPYLVVAADKGTATFSDYANQIALERGFWLGDAFASGGSAGYDHKRLGITARGGWECVKRHFREMDVDVQRQPFRVIGVGDMSGDVFGNAMLLSPQIRLVAAFDHRDIFIDPTPDPAVSFAERKRLFDLPRSSWADYDSSRISPGGGVYTRSAKSIPLSDAARQMLGLPAADVTPAEVIQAILRSEADLLWFGGIGTFIRESGETDDQVGDRANDAFRIAASEVRAKVIGEGANLGVTQRGRIEAAQRGIRLDTDFIDNSAGVNTSDQEVNIKIALEPAMNAGRLSREDRNQLLAAMSADVAAAVLANNHAQGLALSLAERASRRDMGGLVRLTRQLEERGLIDRRLEALPTGNEMSQRAAAGKGLTRPELAVLLSWSKIALNADLLKSSLPADAEGTLARYFPPLLRERHAAEIAGHRLAREIVATQLTNRIVNLGGPDVIQRLAAGIGPDAVAGVPELAEAFLATCEIFDIERMWSDLDALDGRVAGALQLDLYEVLQELCIAEAVRLLRERRGRSAAELVAFYAPAAREVMTSAARMLPESKHAGLVAQTTKLVGGGVPREIAEQHASLDVARQALGLADRAARSRSSIAETARVVWAADTLISLDEIRRRTAALAPADDFDREAIETSLSVIERAARSSADRMLADATANGVSLEAWAARNAPSLLEARPVIARALAGPGFSIARLGVIADAVRPVAQS